MRTGGKKSEGVDLKLQVLYKTLHSILISTILAYCVRASRNGTIINASNLFFMISNVDPFSAKPVLNFIITAYNDQAVIAILIY